MSKPLVVLDFDGTLTDVEKEGAGFEQAYRREFNALVGRDVTHVWDAEAARVLPDPEAGWTVNGAVVAPASCDPYIRCTCVAYAVCDRLGVLQHVDVRGELLSVLYGYCYRQFPEPHFRPDAKAVLEQLTASGAKVVIVTNSDATVVQGKLKKLDARLAEDIDVVGNAKKYIVIEDGHDDPAFLALSDVRMPGLKRALKVRRPFYFKALHWLWEKTPATPQTTLVCGDIFELDLLVPLALGARGHLVLRQSVLRYETDALASFGGRGTSSTELSGVLPQVKALLGRS